MVIDSRRVGRRAAVTQVTASTSPGGHEVPNSGKRILALTLGEDRIASSRVRVGTPLKTLTLEGWRTERITATSASWPARFLAKLVVFHPAVTIIQKVVPPAWFCRGVALLSRRLVFECDDAIQLGDKFDPDSARTITERLRALLPLCDCVTVSNSVLGEDFRKLGARRVIVFPGPAPAVMEQDREERGGILWLGSPSTLTNVQSVVYPALDMLPFEIALTVIGADRDFDSDRIVERVWSMELQQAALARASIGVAPQAQDEWSLRKAFYKVLEYLAAGVVPVVPSHPAINTLLGEELEVVAVMAGDDAPATWAVAIERAMDVVVDDSWIAARDRIFTRWSAHRLGRVMLE